MTRPIPAGTTNVAVNWLIEERWLLDMHLKRRKAKLSVGELTRKAVRFFIAQTDPEAAKRLARVRRERLRATKALAMVGLTALQFFCGGEMRRPSSSVRVVQGVRGRRAD